MKKLLKVMLVLSMVLAIGSPVFAADVVDGVSTGAAPSASVRGNLDFDPACLFNESTPLQVEVNTSTNAVFMAGNGAVLDECSNFTVTGHSAPNFLAWNCNTSNNDGSIPALPEAIYFPRRVSEVMMNVGSSSGAGSTSYLIAYNAASAIIAFDQVTLTPALQTLYVQGAGIQFVVLTGPCKMVADDIIYN